MNHVGPVAERDALDHLVDVEAQSLRIYSDSIFFKDFEQVLLDIFED
jgi:hypothetical protein